MRFASASAPALLSGALEAWERGLDDREAELAAKLLVAPRDAPCTRIDRDAPCTRIDRDAPCTRILWLLDGSSRVDGCCAVRLLAADTGALRIRRVDQRRLSRSIKGRYGLQAASMAASMCVALGRALLD